jgi:asparagine synthase (glutamine-hydrolysing)
MLISFYAKFLKEHSAGLFSHETRFANGAHAIRLLEDHIEESAIAKRILQAALARHSEFLDYSAIQRAQLLEYDLLLAGYLLSSQGDRMTAAHTIEGRCPFLDPELVDIANMIPIKFRLKDGMDEKYILKETFKDKIPDAIRQRPKQPYRAPGAACFLGSRDNWVDDALSRESLKACNVIDVEYAERFLAKLRTARAEQISPRDDQAFVLLLSTVLLHRNFIAAFRPPAYNITNRMVRIVDARSGHFTSH